VSGAIAHLAGPQITYGSVVRQRCAWCGALIEERDLANMAVRVDDSASGEVQQEEASRVGRSGWEGWVEIAGTFPVVKSSVEEPGDGKPPANSCMKLLPAEVSNA